jgi:hypothetical protein
MRTGQTNRHHHTTRAKMIQIGNLITRHSATFILQPAGLLQAASGQPALPISENASASINP